MSRGSVLKKMDQEWQAFCKSFEGLPDGLLMEAGVTGQWSIRDLIAHVTTWENEALMASPVILDGKRPPRYVVYGGIDAFNAQQQDRKKAFPLARVKEELCAVHARMMEYLRSVPEGAFANTRFLHRLAEDTYKHYQQHTQQIAAWRAKRGL